MIESPVLIDILSEQAQKDIIRFLARRFKNVPVELRSRLEMVRDLKQLGELVDWAADCRDLAEFESHLPN